MKITIRAYEKALKDVVELKKAESIIKLWETGLKVIKVDENTEILSINTEDNSFQGRPKEVPRVAGESGRKTA